MCGVFGLSKRSLDDRYMSRWNIQKYLDWNDRYNIRPTQFSPVIIQSQQGNNLELMRFGLIPAWAKTDKLEFSTINAKAETIDKLPTFKKSFQQNRCLVLADGFYEFKPTDSGKQPYYFHLKDEGAMVFAGVFAINENAAAKPIKSYAIVTTPANDIVRKVHPRMPAILTIDDSFEWLNPDNNPNKLKQLLIPFPEKDMESRVVSKLVNSSRNEGPELIKS